MNYYNEICPKTAEWLRELINTGLIPKGEVDERSITDVQPADLRGFTQCHFFAGIGGWPYALRLAGWPADREVWTGSAPCQPFSCAGKQQGAADARNLWPPFMRLIAERKPQFIFGEQVEAAIRSNWFDRVSADLEAEAYAVGSVVLGAHSVGAPHIRQRLYWVGLAQHSERRSVNVNREDGCNGQDTGRQETHGELGTCGEVQWLDNPASTRQQPAGERPEANGSSRQCGFEQGCGNGRFWSDAIWHQCRDGKARRVPPSHGLEPLLQRVADGFPGSLDNRRAISNAAAGFPLSEGIRGRVGLLRGYGNAINPRVAAEFIMAFMES